MNSEVDLFRLPASIDSGDITTALIVWVICLMVTALPSPSGGGIAKSVGSLVSLVVTIAFVACIVWGGWALVQSVQDGPSIDTSANGMQPWATMQEAGMRAALVFPALFIGALWRQRERWLALAALVVAAGTAAWLQWSFLTDWVS